MRGKSKRSISLFDLMNTWSLFANRGGKPHSICNTIQMIWEKFVIYNNLSHELHKFFVCGHLSFFSWRNSFAIKRGVYQPHVVPFIENEQRTRRDSFEMLGSDRDSIGLVCLLIYRYVKSSDLVPILFFFYYCSFFLFSSPSTYARY